MNTERIEVTPEYLSAQGLSPTFPQRFWAKVEKRSTNECWLWIASKGHHGYGQIQKGPLPCRPIAAHRAAWILSFGPVPDGFCVLHNCPGRHNTSCVNPAHLKLGTHTDNMRDKRGQGTNRPVQKLTETQRLEILKTYGGKRGQQAALAREYGVVAGTIHHLVSVG